MLNIKNNMAGNLTIFKSEETNVDPNTKDTNVDPKSKDTNVDPKSKDTNVDPESDDTIVYHNTLMITSANSRGARGAKPRRLAPLTRGVRVRLEIIDSKKEQNIYNLENTDSIVNFVHHVDIHGKMEFLEAVKKILKKENEDKLEILSEDKDNPFGFMVTTAGDLPYEAIFHIKVFEESAKFEEALYRALRRADNMEMRSIALPTLSDQSQASSCLRVLYKFEQRADPICLHMIDIVAENKQDYDYYNNETTKMGEDLW